MSKKEIPRNALIAVADGGKAILLRNVGAGEALSLREERRLTPKDFVDDGPSGSRPEDQSPKATAEATFAKHLIQALTRMHDDNAFTDLVLIADPQTLGQLRDAMHKPLEKSIVFSLAKDYTNESISEITTALA